MGEELHVLTDPKEIKKGYSSLDELVAELNALAPTLLFVSQGNPQTTRGGTEVYLGGVVSELSRLLPRARIMCLYQEFDLDEPVSVQKGVEYHPVHAGKAPKRIVSEINPLNNIAFLTKFMKLVGQANLVHNQSPFYVPVMATAIISSLLGKPQVVTPHSGGGMIDALSYQGRMRYHMFRFAYSIINPLYGVLSTNSTRITNASSVHISSYCPQGFDIGLEEHIDEGLLHKLRSDIGARVPILQAGSLNLNKNQLTTLRALNELIKNGKKEACAIFVYGWEDKKYMAELQDYIGQQGLGDYVLFFHKVPHPSMKAVYAAIRERNGIMVLPSGYEGLPLVMMEAMGFGIPVVTTDRDGRSDVITNNVNGILLEDPLDYIYLSKLLMHLTDTKNSSGYQELSVNAYNRSRDFSLARHVSKLIILYSSLLGLRIPKSSSGLPFFNGVLTPDDHLMPR
ncbi:TPA: glycosyltransferase family 4 protein [Candidatus Woesearchaeota archaeon]|nr:glycosyltransferase family 4 protein [Candidatus Woesearchaeota archaeon]